MFIPRRFDAAFVVSNRHVLLTLEATANLRENHEMACTEPPEMKGDVIVQKVEVRTDRYWPDDVAEFGRLPLRRWTRMAVAAAAGTRDEIRRGVRGDGATERELRKLKPFSDLAPRPVGRPRMESGFKYQGRYIDLDEVLAVAAAGGATPTKAVQETFGNGSS